MSSQPQRRDAGFFEALYKAQEDPWNFATSDYEQARFAAILDALAGHVYQHAFEPACSVGTLTVRLAEVCSRVTACDLSETAIARARQRCAHHTNVTLTCEALTPHTPVGEFDLVVLSEFGYYLDAHQWSSIVDALVQGLRPGTTVIACHWLGRAEGHLQTADEVHETLHRQPLLSLTFEQTYRNFTDRPGFRLDRFVRLERTPTA